MYQTVRINKLRKLTDKRKWETLHFIIIIIGAHVTKVHQNMSRHQDEYYRLHF